ncbi:MAG TPA: hypothetical protein PLK12_03520, partial [Prolixibacteraceae bacterium]|nr:hypothetical protein [Prolixibacteraceae bacterium]
MHNRSILLICLLTISSLWMRGQETLNFIFGTASEESGLVSVFSPEKYSGAKGYGFDIENTDKVRIIRESEEKDDDWHPGWCTAAEPFYFSVKVPEGVYDVVVAMGHPELEGRVTVKAEARRLMIFEQKVRPGGTYYRSFTLSVRTPRIDSTRSIELKPREVNYMNWDDRLTLEFSGENVAIQAVTIKPKKRYTTLFLAGNSTVTDQDCAPWASWGQMITQYFTPEIVVANYAESGETLSGFKARGRLDKVFTQMKFGDYLFIEFGHNDQKMKGEGIGPWESFTKLLAEYISRTREKGGIPVLITPTQRRSFN